MTMTGHSALFTLSALCCTAAMFTRAAGVASCQSAPLAGLCVHYPLVIQQPRPAVFFPPPPPPEMDMAISVSASILCTLSEPSIRVRDLKCPLLP